MAQARINTENFNINSSLQIGDELYFTCVNNTLTAGFTTLNNEPTFLGTVIQITNDYIDFESDNPILAPACDNVFISFKKDCAVNTGGLKGYFASATFINDDFRNKNELFAISAQASYSSK
jgi:hypothetical protein|tara:strand:- start:398 stop:760 length:363 start_codon:yes stop_codon:yes gene_type:complete